MSVAAVPLAHTPDAESAPSENIGKEAIRRQIPSLRNREVYVAVAVRPENRMPRRARNLG